MANMLVETLAGDFDPDEFEDDYAEAVEALVKAKIEGGEVQQAPPRPRRSGEVVDLLAALQRSRSRRRRPPAARPPPRRRRGHEVRAEEGPGEEGGRQEDDHQEGRREEDRGEGQLRYAGLAGRPRPPGRG